MTRNEFLEQFSLIWQMRFDLPDQMMSEINEIRKELRYMSEEDDYTSLSEWANDILREEGYPELYSN